MSAMCSVDWGCEFIGTPDEVREHEKTHDIKYKWKIVGRKPYGRIGYINIFERVED